MKNSRRLFIVLCAACAFFFFTLNFNGGSHAQSNEEFYEQGREAGRLEILTAILDASVQSFNAESKLTKAHVKNIDAKSTIIHVVYETNNRSTSSPELKANLEKNYAQTMTAQCNNPSFLFLLKLDATYIITVEHKGEDLFEYRVSRSVCDELK